MSIASRWSGRRALWRRGLKPLRRVLEQRLALDRWRPHLPIAVAMVALGMLSRMLLVHGSEPGTQS